MQKVNGKLDIVAGLYWVVDTPKFLKNLALFLWKDFAVEKNLRDCKGPGMSRLAFQRFMTNRKKLQKIDQLDRLLRASSNAARQQYGINFIKT